MDQNLSLTQLFMRWQTRQMVQYTASKINVKKSLYETDVFQCYIKTETLAITELLLFSLSTKEIAGLTLQHVNKQTEIFAVLKSIDIACIAFTNKKIRQLLLLASLFVA